MLVHCSFPWLFEVYLTEWCAADNVSVEYCIYMDGHAINIDMIKVPESQKRKGCATAIMQKIIALCKSNNVSITLTPDDSFGTPKPVLFHFYKKLGFELLNENCDSLYINNKRVFLMGDMGIINIKRVIKA